MDSTPFPGATLTLNVSGTVDAGSYDFTVSLSDGGTPATAIGTLVVSPRPITITADDKTKDYGAALPTLSVSYSGLVNGDSAPATPPSISTTGLATSPVGTYPITATGAVDANYNISYAPGTLTVEAVDLLITADDKTKDYGAALPTLSVSYSGLVNGDMAPATPPSISTTGLASSPVWILIRLRLPVLSMQTITFHMSMEL